MGFRPQLPAYGQCPRTLGDFNGEGLGIEVDFSLAAERVIRSLNQIIEWRGRPFAIRVDNVQYSERSVFWQQVVIAPVSRCVWIMMQAMKPLCSGINVSTNADSNARTSSDLPDQQKQLTGRSRSIDQLRT